MGEYDKRHADSASKPKPTAPTTDNGCDDVRRPRFSQKWGSLTRKIVDDDEGSIVRAHKKPAIGKFVNAIEGKPDLAKHKLSFHALVGNVFKMIKLRSYKPPGLQAIGELHELDYNIFDVDKSDAPQQTMKEPDDFVMPGELPSALFPPDPFAHPPDQVVMPADEPDQVVVSADRPNQVAILAHASLTGERTAAHAQKAVSI